MNRKKLVQRVLIGLALLIVAVLVVVYLRFRSQVDLAFMQGEAGLADITVPPGFVVNVFSQGLEGPRFIHFGPDGALYVADRGNNRIVRLPDANGDGVADGIEVFADEVNGPHSLVYHEDAWYVGVPSGVIRLVDGDGDHVADSRTTLIDDYPTSGHATRTVLFLADGRLAVSVGSSCNVCQEEDPRRASVVVYDGPDAAGERIFAPGLRNAVGLALHPETGELWATNNGRDLMGDDLPPETVYIVREGVHYGWPFCHNGTIVDPDEGFDGACEGVATPVVEMQAHSAPLGLAFYTGDMFPAAYQNDLFIAFHGSWNRSVPTGYKIVHVPLDGDTPTGPVTDFATGWLNEAAGETSGRPVGLAVGPDGALYVSDDRGGFIYRIAYTGES